MLNKGFTAILDLIIFAIVVFAIVAFGLHWKEYSNEFSGTLVWGIILGLATIRISLHQSKINEDKLKLDLYDRRFEVYRITLKYYQGFMDDNWPKEEVRYNFIELKEASYFLFPKKTGIYATLEEIHKLGVKIKGWKEEVDKTLHVAAIIPNEINKMTLEVNKLKEALEQVLVIKK